MSINYLLRINTLMHGRIFQRLNSIFDKNIYPKIYCNNKTHSWIRFSSNIRNVGIFAHIDAGKTTTTERMLYYSGFTPSVGEVHTGDTVMDYMDQERERGITITSAAITFPWNKHQINLIDTPGHVDFTLEVERSLRVLDGGILILDGSAGVQAQTVTVCRQAKRYYLPKIVFINKMDKRNANLNKSLDSLELKLGIQPLLTQYPIYKEDILSGLVDLISMEKVLWNKESLGKEYVKSQIQKEDEMYDISVQKRIELIDNLCDLDESLSSKLLESGNYENISGQEIEHALRLITLNNYDAVLVLLGSSYKNIGIQLLLDAITKYLPPPKALKNHSNNFLGMVFKIIHHPNKGALSFIRIYSGKLKVGDLVFNVNKGKSEKIQQLLIAFADDFRSVNEVSHGNIAVISGFKESVTGDTLTSNKNSIDQLIGVPVPNPVMYCTIEPPSMSQQSQLELALKNLSREDPSFRVSVDEVTGQTLLSGMGELHLSIMRDRIESEYKVDADLGSVLVSYKEAPMEEAELTYEFNRNILNKSHSIIIGIIVRPIHGNGVGMTEPKLIMNSAKYSTLGELRPWQHKAIKRGFDLSVSSGPLLSSSVVDSEFEITLVEINGKTKDTLIASAVSDAMKAVLKSSNVRLLEPIMRLEICTDSSEASKITRDITMKRGIINKEEDDVGSYRLIEATIPLAELKGYSQHLRTITSGKANFGMEISHYDIVDADSQNEVIKEVTGFVPK
ncbi:ribosome-releasing factor 2, mitochondrial [Lepeophtheirus salmonis]|uniref:ribosome-releasing factor 2, mitochondrial n=1 Tax=Lepeophtheirus salmonis TaxID=72036 RepID=UPI001AE4EEC6|nr:ribosome-releasing factor 2, mitochondrial-like [Lepeophtheirus salmonis]